MDRVRQTNDRSSKRDLQRGTIRYFGCIDCRQMNQDSTSASTDIEH